MLATSLVLCAAVLHATWNTLVKFSSDRLLVVACMDVVGVLCAILLLPFVSLPPAEVWPWLLGATVLQLLYRVLLIEAYKVGDLGLVYPLMRGLSPLVVLGLTLAFGGEQLSGRQILGILLIPFGMLCLLWGGGGSRLPWRTLPVVLLIGLCIGGYTWSDGNALKRWPLALDYLVWLTLLSGLPFPLISVGARTRAFARFWALEWKLGLAVGVCVLASYGLVLWAMQLGSIAEAAALRETSVLLDRSRKPLSRKVLFRAMELYVERFAEADGKVPATFEIVSVTGWAPHDSQQKPLRPGSAKMRLADALGVKEQPAGDKAGS